MIGGFVCEFRNIHDLFVCTSSEFHPNTSKLTCNWQIALLFEWQKKSILVSKQRSSYDTLQWICMIKAVWGGAASMPEQLHLSYFLAILCVSHGAHVWYSCSVVSWALPHTLLRNVLFQYCLSQCLSNPHWVGLIFSFVETNFLSCPFCLSAHYLRFFSEMWPIWVGAREAVVYNATPLDLLASEWDLVFVQSLAQTEVLYHRYKLSGKVTI